MALFAGQPPSRPQFRSTAIEERNAASPTGSISSGSASVGDVTYAEGDAYGGTRRSHIAAKAWRPDPDVPDRPDFAAHWCHQVVDRGLFWLKGSTAGVHEVLWTAKDDAAGRTERRGVAQA
jgi:hypothetical protein